MRRSVQVGIAAVAALLLSAPAAARAESVKLRVVELAGGRAYLEPGEEAGIVQGMAVEIGGRRFRVVAATAKHAVVEDPDRRLSVGDRGEARAQAKARVERMPPPPPLSRFAGQWRELVWPSTRQSPARVPLGRGGPAGAWQARLTGHTQSAFPLGFAFVSVGAEVHARPWRELPFAVDADAALLVWLGPGGRLGGPSRPPLRVRELRLRLGDARAPYAAIGRLRHAASTVGLLDGVRLATPSWHGLTLAGFGGYVPDLLSGRPALDAARFGAELGWSRRHRWRPRLGLVAHGSTWQGVLDERRLAADLRLDSGATTLAAYGEVSGFDGDNPWGMAPVELTAAGAEAGVELGPAHAAVRVDLRQPERSRYLASLLPPGWLCAATPQPPGTPAEPCDGASGYRYLAAANAGVRLGRVSLDGAATAIAADDSSQLTGSVDLRVVRLPLGTRADAGVSASRGGFIEAYAARAGVGWTGLNGLLDASVWVRGSLFAYQASVDTWREGRAGLDVAYTPRSDLDVVVSVEATGGPDLDAVALLSTVVWRLR